jgi:hypothetical protein
MNPEQEARVDALNAASGVLVSRPPSKGPFTPGGQQPPEVDDLLTVASFILDGSAGAVVFRRSWDQNVLFDSVEDEQ